MILVIDNYDSFVYNLSRYISELGFSPVIFRNDSITIDTIIKMAPKKIVLSPGPCDPSRAGITLQVIEVLGSGTPILGVCLGHQAIGQAYGGVVKKAIVPVHGKSTAITHVEKGLFKNLPSPLMVGRYHSLVVDRNSLPEDLCVTAESDAGEIMALQHKIHPVFGVQFHPESVLTDEGYKLLHNFLSL